MDYRHIHTISPHYGRTGARLLPLAEAILKECNPKRILDFGCGKGALGQLIRQKGYNIQLYDPFVEEYKEEPVGEYDLLLCTDVLEHITQEDLPSLLNGAKSLSSKCVFVISTTFADQLLINGDNAHCTIQNRNWWREKLLETFPVVSEIPSIIPTAVAFVTWSVTPHTIQKIDLARKSFEAKKLAYEMISGLVAQTLAPVKRGLSRKDLMEKCCGKTVAIVGNSPALAKSAWGELIDSHDIVVRINRAPIITAKSHGKKTNWIATSIPVSSGLIDGRKVDVTIWGTAKRSRLPLWAVSGRPVYIPERREFAEISQHLSGRRPSTGYTVAKLLAGSGAKAVTIFGFDGFVTGSLSGGHTAASTPHDFSAEMRSLHQLCQQDPRFQIKAVAES